MTRRRRAGGSWLIAALVGMLHLPVHPASLFDGKNPRDVQAEVDSGAFDCPDE